MKFAGRKILLYLADGSDFVLVAGQRVTSFSIGQEVIDTTSKDGTRWKELMEGGVRSASLACAGLLQSAAVHKTLLDLARTGTIADWRVVFFNTNWSFDISGILTSVEGTGEYTDAQTYSLTIEGADDGAVDEGSDITSDSDPGPPATICTGKLLANVDPDDADQTVENTGTTLPFGSLPDGQFLHALNVESSSPQFTVISDVMDVTGTPVGFDVLVLVEVFGFGNDWPLPFDPNPVTALGATLTVRINGATVDTFTVIANTTGRHPECPTYGAMLLCVHTDSIDVLDRTA